MVTEVYGKGISENKEADRECTPYNQLSIIRTAGKAQFDRSSPLLPVPKQVCLSLSRKSRAVAQNRISPNQLINVSGKNE